MRRESRSSSPFLPDLAKHKSKSKSRSSSKSKSKTRSESDLRPPHHANATRTLFQNPWQTPSEPGHEPEDPNTILNANAKRNGKTIATGSAIGKLEVPSRALSLPVPNAHSKVRATSRSEPASDSEDRPTSSLSPALAPSRSLSASPAPSSSSKVSGKTNAVASANGNGNGGRLIPPARLLSLPSLSLPSLSFPSLPPLSALVANIPLEWAQDLSKHGIQPTKVVKPEFGKCRDLVDVESRAKGKGSVKATWLGHASFLVELPLQKDCEKPIRVLFDPMFSERAGPSQWTGIRRRLPPPCTIAGLPEFHFVCISHNHYDHLDVPSIQEIVRTRGDKVTFFVPLGVKSLLASCGTLNFRIHELDWWDEVSIACPYTLSENVPTFPNVSFICVPAQHTSGRSVVDRNRTLWCGWVVKQEGQDVESARVYHAGDTGYMGTNGACPAFKEIGEKCGPMDLSMIPIWRGGTLAFISQLGLRLTHHPSLTSMHAHPSDAVSIHRDVCSRHSLAMHFATFVGSDTEVLESLLELTRAREEYKCGDWWEEGGIGAIDVGETVEVSTTKDEKDE